MICEVMVGVQSEESNGPLLELFFNQLFSSGEGFTSLISFMMVFLGMLGCLIVVNKHILKGSPSDSYQIVKELDAKGFDFYLTVIVPLISLGVLHGWSAFIAFILTASFLIWLMWKTDTWYQNPILIAFGFHFYAACLGCEHTCIVFVSKRELSGEGNISYAPICDKYFFVKDARNLPIGSIHG